MHVGRQLWDEVGSVVRLVRERLHDRGMRAVGLAIAATTVCLVVSALGRDHATRQAIIALCGERSTLPLLTALSRLPGSLLWPSPPLPVWGAVAQLALTVAIAEIMRSA